MSDEFSIGISGAQWAIMREYIGLPHVENPDMSHLAAFLAKAAPDNTPPLIKALADEFLNVIGAQAPGNLPIDHPIFRPQQTEKQILRDHLGKMGDDYRPVAPENLATTLLQSDILSKIGSRGHRYFIRDIRMATTDQQIGWTIFRINQELPIGVHVQIVSSENMSLSPAEKHEAFVEFLEGLEYEPVLTFDQYHSFIRHSQLGPLLIALDNEGKPHPELDNTPKTLGFFSISQIRANRPHPIFTPEGFDQTTGSENSVITLGPEKAVVLFSGLNPKETAILTKEDGQLRLRIIHNTEISTAIKKHFLSDQPLQSTVIRNILNITPLSIVELTDSRGSLDRKNKKIRHGKLGDRQLLVEIRKMPNDGNHTKHHFVYTDSNFVRLMQLALSDKSTKVSYSQEAITYIGVLFSKYRPGVREYALVFPYIHGDIGIQLIPEELAKKIISKTITPDELEDTKTWASLDYKPNRDQPRKYKPTDSAHNHLELHLYPEGFRHYYHNEISDWTPYDPNKNITPLVTTEQLRRLKRGDTNVREIILSNGSSHLFFELVSDLGRGLLSLVDDEIGFIPVHTNTDSWKEDDFVPPYVISKNGIVQIQRYGPDTFQLAVDPDALTFVLSNREGLETYHPLTFANKPLPVISFDPYFESIQLVDQINGLTPELAAQPVRINESSAGDESFPIFLTFSKDGTKKLTPGSFRGRQDDPADNKVHIQWGSSQATRLPYLLTVENGKKYLAPADDKAPAGQLLLTFDESIQNYFVQPTQPDSALAHYLKAGFHGPQLSIEFARQVGGKARLIFTGHYDGEQNLLNQLKSLWATALGEQSISALPQGDWRFGIDLSQPNEPALEQTLRWYQKSLATPRVPNTLVAQRSEKPVEKAKPQPPAAATPVPVLTHQATVPSNENLPEIISARWSRAHAESAWELTSLRYGAQDLLATNNKTNQLVTKKSDTGFDVWARFDQGWVHFEVVLGSNDDLPTLAIHNHPRWNFSEHTSNFTSPTSNEHIGPITFEVREHPPVTQIRELTGIVWPELLGTTTTSHLPLPWVEPFTLTANNTYLGEIALTVIHDATTGEYKIIWPQSEYVQDLVFAENSEEAALELLGDGDDLSISLSPIAGGRFILDTKGLALFNQWRALFGQTPLALESPENSAYEPLQGDGEIIFKVVHKNTDGTYAPTHLPHADVDRTLMEQTAGDAIAYKPDAFFHANDWDLKPGDIFLPTKEQVLALSQLYKKALSQGRNFLEASDLQTQATFDVALPNGFTLNLPVEIAHRQTNPFRLVAHGRLTLNEAQIPQTNAQGHPIADGRRLQASINRADFDHRWVFADFAEALDQGGNWVITMATPRGAHLLTMVRHPDSRDLMAFVDTTAVQNDPEARAELIKQTKESLAMHVEAVFRSEFRQPAVFKMSGFSKNSDTTRGAAITYHGTMGENHLSIEGITWQNNEWHIPQTVMVAMSGATINRTLQTEVSLDPDSPHRVLLTDYSKSAPVTYVWDRNLNLFYPQEFTSKTYADDIDFSTTLKINRLPLRTKQGRPVTGEREATHLDAKPYTLQTNQPTPLMPNSQRAFVIPDPDRIQTLSEAPAIEQFLKEHSLNDLVFLPSETDAIIQAHQLSTQTIMSFGTRSGAILQLPMRQIDGSHNYTFDWEASTDTHLKGARLLVPNSKRSGEYVELRVSPTEKIRSGSSTATLTLNLSDLPKSNFKLNRIEEDTGRGHKAIGYHMTINGSSQLNAKSTHAILSSWIRRLGLEVAADLYDQNISEGLDQLTLNDGTRLDIGLSPTQREFVLDQVRHIAAADYSPARALIINSDGQEFELHQDDENSRIFYLKNTHNDTWDYLILTPTGKLILWNRLPHIRDFMHPPRSVNFLEYTIAGTIYGGSHHKAAESMATRTKLNDKDGFEITAALGRWVATDASDLEETSTSPLARVRFNISVNDQDKLNAEPGIIRKRSSSSDTAYFPWGENFLMNIAEDEWLSEIGESVRGRIRVIFHKNDHENSNHQPYGWMEFINREALIGAAKDFSVAQAHHHVSNGYQDRKLMPDDEGFLIKRTGVAVGDSIDFGAIFKTLATKAQSLIEDLKETKARHSDIFSLVEGFKSLQTLTRNNRIEFSHSIFEGKSLNESVLREWAKFAFELSTPPSPEGTGSGRQRPKTNPSLKLGPALASTRSAGATTEKPSISNIVELMGRMGRFQRPQVPSWQPRKLVKPLPANDNAFNIRAKTPVQIDERLPEGQLIYLDRERDLQARLTRPLEMDATNALPNGAQILAFPTANFGAGAMMFRGAMMGR